MKKGGGQTYGDGWRLDSVWVVSTQCNIQMMYSNVVHLKHILLLTKVMPTNLNYKWQQGREDQRES